MRIYKLHRYVEIPCDFPHTSFVEDLKKLYEIYGDMEQFALFLNNHSAEYLQNLIGSHQPLLRHHLLSLDSSFRGKRRYKQTFEAYFAEITHRRLAREAQEKAERTANGHTEPKQ